MLLMLFTLDMFQFDTSNDDNDEQSWNMFHIPVTFDVSQFDTSTDENLEQL